MIRKLKTILCYPYNFIICYREKMHTNEMEVVVRFYVQSEILAEYLLLQDLVSSVFLSVN